MRTAIILTLAALAIQGCAHAPSAEDRLDEKLSREPTPKSSRELRAEADQLIAKASGLSPSQRSELLALRATVSEQADKLKAQSLKLRSLLIRDILASTYDQTEVTLIKKRIRDVEHQRLSVFFQAVRTANNDFGRWGSRNDRLTNDVLDEMIYDMFEAN